MNSLLHLGPFRIPTTGVFAAVGLVLALLLAQRMARYAVVAAPALWDAGLTAVLAAMIASRLILVAFNWSTFLAFPMLVLTLPSLTAFGVLLAAMAVGVYLRVKRLPASRVADAYAAPAMLLWAVFALGDLATGNHAGLPTASKFSLYDPLWGRVLPAEPITAILALVAMVLLLRQIVKPHAAGAVAARGLALFGAALFLAVFVRQPDPLTQSLLLDPVQWAALVCVVIGTVAELAIRRGPLVNAQPPEIRTSELQTPAAQPDSEESLHAL